MLIKSIVAPDDVNTIYGMECTVTMQELLVAQVQTVKISKRTQTTGSTDNGVIAMQPADQSILSQLFG